MAKKRGGYKNLTGNWQDTVNGIVRSDNFVPGEGAKGYSPDWDNRPPVRDSGGRPLIPGGNGKVDWVRWAAELEEQKKKG